MRVGFEIEAYLVREDALFFLSRDEVRRVNSSIPESKFHTIESYAVEGKTDSPHERPLLSATNALNNLEEGLAIVRRVTGTNAELETQATGERFFGADQPHELLGTHVHLDYEPIRKSLPRVKPERVVWEMRQSLPKLIQNYAPSQRLRYRLQDADEDFHNLDVHSAKKRTINYRPGLGTIEFSFPDATTDIQTLTRLGLDVQNLAKQTIKTLMDNPVRLPSPKVRSAEMRRMLAAYL